MAAAPYTFATRPNGRAHRLGIEYIPGCAINAPRSLVPETIGQFYGRYNHSREDWDCKAKMNRFAGHRQPVSAANHQETRNIARVAGLNEGLYIQPSAVSHNFWEFIIVFQAVISEFEANCMHL